MTISARDHIWIGLYTAAYVALEQKHMALDIGPLSSAESYGCASDAQYIADQGLAAYDKLPHTDPVVVKRDI